MFEPASSSDQDERMETQRISSSSSSPPPPPPKSQPDDEEPTRAERLRRVGVAPQEERDVQFRHIELKSDEFQETEHEPQVKDRKPPKRVPGFADPAETREANKAKSRTCRLL
jgi:hypothetical protein